MDLGDGSRIWTGTRVSCTGIKSAVWTLCKAVQHRKCPRIKTSLHLRCGKHTPKCEPTESTAEIRTKACTEMFSTDSLIVNRDGTQSRYPLVMAVWINVTESHSRTSPSNSEMERTPDLHNWGEFQKLPSRGIFQGATVQPENFIYLFLILFIIIKTENFINKELWSMQNYPPVVDATILHQSCTHRHREELNWIPTPYQTQNSAWGFEARMGHAEKRAHRKQHENRPINISSTRCKTPSIKGNIDKTTFYWNPEPSIKVTLSINAFRTAEAKPHICAQLAGGALTMTGNQSRAHSLKQINNKKEKETDDSEDNVWDSCLTMWPALI